MMNTKRAWTLTYPIFLGYISVGFVFGMMTVSAGIPWLYAVASSVFLYAGASQFLLVSSVKAVTPIIDIFVSIFLLNLRHIFYFKPVASKIESRGPKRWYSVFSMTDEVFALLSDSHVKKDDSFLILLFSQGYWILGTFLGAVLGGLLASTHIEGLDFSLIALFVVLFIEKLNWKKDQWVLTLCLGICTVAWVLIPASFFLITSIAICLMLAAWLEARKS